MNDQKKYWNSAHAKGNIDHYSKKSTAFAEEVLAIVRPKSNILELGCGVGNDSVAFARAGHTICATDFSDVAVQKNAERFHDIPHLSFEVVDIRQCLNFPDNTFDCVYARLSLHYFTDIVTKKIFQEIHRVSKPNGLLCFICKSIDDPLYGKGVQIEKDMFEENGHVRHFFSEEYTRECLQNNFKVEKLETGKETFYGRESAFVKVIARVQK